jgi:hypothetical protein
MDRIQRMRAGQNKAAQPATKPAPSPEAKPAKAPPAVILHICGCEQPVAAVAGTPCPACQSRTRRDRAARKHAKRQVKQPHKYQTPRLPDGAVFTVAYDATRESWSGTLAVEGQTFTGTESGVFRLLAQLDQKYRAGGPVESQS